jgi:hypothetical protein
MPQHSAETTEKQSVSVLAALEAGNGSIRKREGQWLLQSPHLHRAVAVPPAVVALLLSRGHLVPGRSGGLQARTASLRDDARLSSHRPARPTEGAAAPVINDAESPLAWLRARKDGSGKPLIGDEQFLAGERLRADYEKSCLERRTTASWDASKVAGPSSGNRVAELTDSMIAARQNFHKALDAVGPELSGMLVQVCCLSAGIEQAERLLDMPRRAGRAVLGLALTSLARHYGFLKTANSGARRTAMAHWGTADFRPAIPPQAGS